MGDLTGMLATRDMAISWDLEAWRGAVDRRLEEATAFPDGPCADLCDAVRYSARAPGKRLRPLLCLSAARDLGADPHGVLDCACAFELVHTASLVFDDLPCMDDASLRRGQPAAHVTFGESTAVLAAISQLSQAFGLVSASSGLTEAARMAIVRVLSDAVGVHGLAAGQYADLARRQPAHGHALAAIHAGKTGALFAAAAEAGGLAAGAGLRQRAHLRDLGMAIGMAFQAFDDVLDTAGSVQATGKDVGQDRRLGVRGDERTLEEAGDAIFQHLAAAETAVAALSNRDGALHSFTRHLRLALKRHLSQCLEQGTNP